MLPSNPVTTINRDDCELPLRIQALANAIYHEVEKIIKNHNPEIIHDLMPFIVSALDSLESIHCKKQSLQSNLDIAKRDHIGLLKEYEKEKNARRTAESKLIDLEYHYDEEADKVKDACLSAESNCRVLELRVKNLTEQLSKCEVKESEMHEKYERLHERYAYLIRSYVNFMDGHNINSNMTESNSTTKASTYTLTHGESEQNLNFSSPKQSEKPAFLRSDSFDTDDDNRIQINIDSSPEFNNSSPFHDRFGLDEQSFDELSQTDLNDDIHSCDGSTGTPMPANPESNSFEFLQGVSREVHNLVKENEDLIQTKNALNVVTNDLIGRIEQLTAENERIKFDLKTVSTSRAAVSIRAKDLEEHNRSLRLELERLELGRSLYSDSRGDNGELLCGIDLDGIERKYYLGSEMARVLLERNQYKEQLLDLQETIRWTESLRAQQREQLKGSRKTKRGGRFWQFFADLFKPPKSADRRSVPSVYYDATRGTVSIEEDSSRSSRNKSLNRPRTNSIATTNSSSNKLRRPSSSNLIVDWFLPMGKKESAARLSELPRTIYMRPLAAYLSGTLFWCATGLESQAPVQLLAADSCPASSTASSANSTPRRRSRSSLMSSQSSSASPLAASSARKTRAGSMIDHCQSIAEVDNNNDLTRHTPVWCCSILTQPITTDMATPVDCGGGGGTSHPSANYDGEAVPNPSQSRPISNQLRTLVTVIDADHPEANVDSFAISTSPVLSILSVPAYTPSTSPTLPSTSSTSTATAASQWNAVPLNLSDELIVEGYDTQFLTASFMMSTSLMSMSSQQQPNQSVTAGSVEDVHSTTNPSVDTKKPTTTSTLSPTNPISGSRSRLTDIPSSPCPSEDPNSGGANTGLAYFVERRRFVVQPLNDNASEVRLRHHREQTSSDKASSSADQTNENDSLLQPSVEQPSSSSTVSTQNYQRQDLTGSTVWLGCQNGDLYVHNSSSSSSEQQLSLRKRCLQLVHLPDSILGMCHLNGRVFCSLANGQIVAFRRQILPALKASPSSDVLVDSDCPSPKPDSTYRTSTVVGDACCWDFTEACVVTCSRSRSDLTSPLPVQAIPSAATTTTTSCSQDTVWVGSRGLLLIIDADSLQLLNCLQVDTSLEAQVRQLICSTSPSSSTSIVWASFRRSSLLRSFDTSTYQPLHCIDLKPVISRALAGEFNTSNQVEPITDSGQLSITALQTTTSVSSPQLWIGTNLGLIALLPTLNAEKSNINMKLLRVCRQRFRGPVKQILALSHSQRVLAFGQGVHLENEEAWKLLSSASPRPSNESRDDGGESPNRQLQSTPTDPGCDIIAWQLA